MRYMFAAVVLLFSGQVAAVEHPGVLPSGAACVSCHADKTRGRSVHSAMALPCNVCHIAVTREDLTTVNLAAPKEQICFGCHLQAAEIQRHVPVAKGECVDCHDPHSSRRRLLLHAHARSVRPNTCCK